MTAPALITEASEATLRMAKTLGTEFVRDPKWQKGQATALADEPVAFLYESETGDKDLVLDCNGEYARRLLELGRTETPLYAAPPVDRNAVLEEAAQIADAEYRHLTNCYQKPAKKDAETAFRISRAIRALRTEAPTQVEPVEGLAARCEKAEGSDRELDALIHFATSGKWVGRIPSWPPESINHSPGAQALIEGPGYIYGDTVPFLTASIDDALTLVPEGWASFCIGTTDDGRGYAQLAGNDAHMMAQDPEEFYAEGDAATPALALCAAALRARSKERGE